jgi:hypothetical protein
MQVMQDAIVHQCQEGNDELVQTLWGIIPQALARFSTNNSLLQGEAFSYFNAFCFSYSFSPVYIICTRTLLIHFLSDQLNLRNILQR